MSDRDGTASAGPWLFVDRAHRELERLGGVLQEAVTVEDPEFAEATLHLLARPGKRLRPALVLVSGEIGSPESCREDLLRCAAATELLHVGSLYHDDIIDRATLRRGGTTASSEYGATLAALAGTYVTARAVGLFLPDARIVPLVSAAMLQLCTGQLQEAQNAFSLDVSPEEHLQIIARKTGALFELPCRIGATVAGAAAAQVDALGRYGRHLGVAFQLTDDALDLEGTAAQLGKPVGLDLTTGAYGLPILLAAQEAGAVASEVRQHVRKRVLDDADRARLAHVLRESGAMATARETARAHSEAAVAALEDMPEGPATASLVALVAHLTDRTR